MQNLVCLLHPALITDCTWGKASSSIIWPITQPGYKVSREPNGPNLMIKKREKAGLCKADTVCSHPSWHFPPPPAFSGNCGGSIPSPAGPQPLWYNQGAWWTLSDGYCTTRYKGACLHFSSIQIFLLLQHVCGNEWRLWLPKLTGSSVQPASGLCCHPVCSTWGEPPVAKDVAALLPRLATRWIHLSLATLFS